MLAINDEHLPGLAELSQSRLRTITGAENVSLLRLRYRAGRRAILHVSVDAGNIRTEGVLWFFKGDKAKRIARRNKATTRFDPDSEALFEAFPNDHRMPQIREFLDRQDTILTDLTGKSPASPPVLLRYRPGLSCTFRCQLEGNTSSYVKVINDDDPSRILDANQTMLRHFIHGPVTIAPALGIDLSASVIAYGGAQGQALDELFSHTKTMLPVDQTIAALRAFWASPLAPLRGMGPEMLSSRARESAEFVAVTAASCNEATRKISARLDTACPEVALRPIHGDMKLEHVFIAENRVILIDTESVSLGPPDYDLAQLYGRLWQAELEGHLPRGLVERASTHVRAQAGPAFDWCLAVVALRLAKFYAQRPDPNMATKITAILERLG